MAITDQVQGELTKSFASAADTAERYPQYRDQIVDAARAAFLAGDHWVYSAGIIAILLGATLIFFRYPKKDDERRLLADYHAEDLSRRAGADRSS